MLSNPIVENWGREVYHCGPVTVMIDPYYPECLERPCVVSYFKGGTMIAFTRVSSREEAIDHATLFLAQHQG